MNKVIGGTPRSSDSLCKTCRAAFHVRTVNLGEIVICRAIGSGLRIPVPIAECGSYDDKRQPGLYDMQQIAWQVQTRNRGIAGFAPDKNLTIEIEPPDPLRNQPAFPPSPIGNPVGK